MSESNSTPTCKLAFWKQRVFFPPLPRPFPPRLFPLTPSLLLAWLGKLGLIWKVWKE